MATFNSCKFLGRLTYEPELKKTPNDISVLRFQVAVNRPYHKGKEEKADFIDCEAWRGNADFISQYFHKGDLIAVDCFQKTSNFTDKDGNKRKSVSNVVESVSFVPGSSKKNSEGSDDGGSNQPAPTYASANNSDFEEIIDDDDDMPF